MAYRTLTPILVALALTLAPLTARAQTMPATGAGSDLTISLVTMGQGDAVWELFGHNAIWIHDASTMADEVWNWGMFSFDQPHFILRFLEGRMLYSMGGFTLDQTLAEYRYLNRTVWSQELDLTNEQKAAIRDYIHWNALPQNADYRYDYYRDNCSTRVRDVIDRALGGAIRAAAATKMTGTTYRWHTLRLMQRMPFTMAGVDIAAGEPTDRDLSAWQTMFLPQQVHDFIRTVRVSDGRGGTKPLVRSEHVLFQATRPPEPSKPPALMLPFLAIGVIVSALFAWLGARARSMDASAVARWTAATVLGAWSLLAGILGTLLTLMWTVTDHIFTHRNENLLLFNPLWIVLGVMLIVSLGSARWERDTRAVAVLATVLACLAPLAHLVRLSSQVNLPVIALALPPALAIAWVTARPVSTPTATRTATASASLAR
ncbi:MAG TPA: DUF4105 domain-containing protein [Gemmatimonadaceae bacterium]